MQCVAAGHQIVALANLRPAENTGMKATFLIGNKKKYIRNNEDTAMPELSSFVCSYVVLHIEGQYRNLKEVENRKCYGRVLNVFFLKGKKKAHKKRRSVKERLTQFENENTDILVVNTRIV